MINLLPIGLLFVLALTVCIVMYVSAYLIGPKNPIAVKLTTYECGVEPEGNAHTPFKSHFYLIAVLFLLFDVEAAFFFPWTLIYREALKEGPTIAIAGAVYLALMALGLVYVFRKGCFKGNG